MSWIVVVTWAGALVFAAVVLGFCAYEVTWKARRVQADLVRLQATQRDVMSLRTALQAAARRLNDAAGSR